MKIFVLLMVVFLAACDEHRASDTVYPKAVQVQVKFSDGSLQWRCLAVSGGGSGETAMPANLDMWTPSADGRRFVEKK